MHVYPQVYVSDAGYLLDTQAHKSARGSGLPGLRPVASHTAHLPGGVPAVGQGATSLEQLCGLLEDFHSLPPEVDST